MARLILTVQDAIGENLGGAPVTLDWTAAGVDFADGAGFALTGKEVILFRGAGGEVVNIYSTPDAMKRVAGTDGIGYVTKTLVGTTEYQYGPLPLKGWRQDDGMLYMAADAATVEFAIVRVP